MEYANTVKISCLNRSFNDEHAPMMRDSFTQVELQKIGIWLIGYGYNFLQFNRKTNNNCTEKDKRKPVKKTKTIIVITIAAVLTAVMIFGSLNAIKQILGFTLNSAFFAAAPLSLDLVYLYILFTLTVSGYAVVSGIRSRIANCLLFALLLVVELACIKLNIIFRQADGTIYPPLSAIPKQQPAMKINWPI